MSNYENAPATKLLATHCCMCGRPLVDSDSVECGIGPICRGKMEPDTAPDWDAVTCWVARWVDLNKADESRLKLFEGAMANLDDNGVLPALDERKLCNLITHAIAATVKERDSGIAFLIMAVRAAGRVQLASILGERLYEIRVIERDGMLLVRSPYSDVFRSEARRIGARWNPEAKCWGVRAAMPMIKPSLMGALGRAYAGQRALFPSGEVVL